MKKLRASRGSVACMVGPTLLWRRLHLIRFTSKEPVKLLFTIIIVMIIIIVILNDNKN